MSELLAIALESMHHDMARLDRVGMNLANAHTTAYKRDTVAVRPFAQLMRDSSVVDAKEAGAAAVLPAAAMSTRIDHRAATLKATGQSLDLALAGAGYFEVQTDRGPAYTRNGAFAVDAQGRLVTAQGHAVMGKGGEITVRSSQPVIDSAGRVFDSAAAADGGTGQPVAQLRVVAFDDQAVLERLGDGLFAAYSGLSVVADEKVQVRQGYLENSNVNSMQEMVQLIQTMRHFESMQRVAVGYDEMIGSAIRKLGETS